MRRLPRRLALWGGAAAIAGGGFAFMASNSVTASGAGEGYGNVSGYNVTTISWNHGTGATCGTLDGCYAHSVQFKLTTANTNTTSQAYQAPPKFVYADIANKTGGYLANADGCSRTTAWTSGAAMYTCTFNPTSIKIVTVGKLNVEANQ